MTTTHSVTLTQRELELVLAAVLITTTTGGPMAGLTKEMFDLGQRLTELNGGNQPANYRLLRELGQAASYNYLDEVKS